MEQQVVFTKRAFNAILTETLDRSPLETGGIFIGYVLDNGVWIVVESIPPGIKTVNRQSYFEYDAEFINYLSNVIAKQYKGNLQVLGLWHRHPGSMDFFSGTDDITNLQFSKANSCGAISALVNCDPKCRITMYYVNHSGEYTRLNWIVDDGLIPDELLELRFNSEMDLPVIDRNGYIINVENDSVGSTIDEESNVGEIERGGVESQYTIKDAVRDFKVIVNKLLKL